VVDPVLDAGAGSANSGGQSSFLVEMVQMIGARLLAGIQTVEDSGDADADADSWRYREEAEKDHAAAGSIPSLDRAERPAVKDGPHRRLRQVYLWLMHGLA